MKNPIWFQLSLMMFMNFFIWGIWFVTLGTYLGPELKVEGVQIGAAYGTQALGSIIAPFIIGMIADRYFSAQKILGVLHLAGAGLMYYCLLGIDANGLQLAEGGAFGAQNCLSALMFIKCTTVQLPTSAPLLARCC